MLILLKFLHLLAMAVGVGFGIMKAIIGARTGQLGAEAAAERRALQQIMGRIGLVALAIIWLTGLAIFGGTYDWQVEGLGWAFHAKMLFVVLFTAASLAALWLGARSRRTGVPPRAELMKAVGTGGLIALILAVIFAVVTFG